MSANKLPPITVRGTVYWCERNKLNKYSNKYQVQLGNLSEKAVEAIEEMGIAPSNKGDEREFFITASPVARPSTGTFYLKSNVDNATSQPVILKVLPDREEQVSSR